MSIDDLSDNRDSFCLNRIAAMIKVGKFAEAAKYGADVFNKTPLEVMSYRIVKGGEIEKRVDFIIRESRDGLVSTFHNEIIQPEKAQLLLGKNDDNRVISRVPLESYMRSLWHGRWQYTGLPIILAKTGEINDGQTRLLACLLTGVPFRAPITVGVTRESRFFIDIGKRRTPGDRSGMAGIVNGKKKSESAALAFWQMLGRKPFPDERDEYLERKMSFYNTAHDLTRKVPTGANRTSYIAAVAYLLESGVNSNLIYEFMAALRGEGILVAGSPVFPLISDSGKSKKLKDPRQQMRTIVAHYNAYTRGDRVFSLKYPDHLELAEGIDA